MTTQITRGIKISVKTFPIPGNPIAENNNSPLPQEQYFFSYVISIENKSEQTVQLLKRHWEIFDSSGIIRVVSGEGVVGEKPVIKPGEKYEYNSCCGFSSDMGRMRGNYLMVTQPEGKLFSVIIPEFEMYVSYRMN